MLMRRSPARRLAVDDDVDAKHKSSMEAGRQRRCESSECWKLTIRSAMKVVVNK
jgi:hypothetical protein